MNDDPKGHYEFGNCLLDTEKKVLWCDERPVALPLKAVELLAVLVGRAGAVITKDEIWRSVWSDSFVEETNLTHNIYVLRKTLKGLGHGDVIETVPRRGYRFAGEVRAATGSDLIIERHSYTKTIVEELASDDVTIPTKLGLTSGSVYATKYFLPIVIVVLVMLLGGLSVWKLRATGSEASEMRIRSIAVVPLDSISDGTDDRALTLGFGDALITSLGAVKDVRVVSARSAEKSGEAHDPALLGRELSVDSVLEGTLQRANGKIRVTLRLIRSDDGKQIWSASFDESENDIFKLQDMMALQTAAALSREVRFDRHSTKNLDAYHAYLRGRFFFDKRNSENYKKAIDEFSLAVSIDPQYALAYAGLADVFAMQANISGHDRNRRDELYEKSRSMALQALAIDDRCAEAHTSLAWIKRVHDWDWNGSEDGFKRAIELNPNYANARQWYSFLLLGLGRMDESLEQMQKAIELEPMSRIVVNNLFTVRNYRGELDMLPAIAERASRMDDSEYGGLRLLSLGYSRNGQHFKVIELGEAQLAKSNGKLNDDYLASSLAIAYARTGQSSKAAAVLARLEEKAKANSETAFRLAQAHADLGNADKAIELLRKCLEARDDRMVWLKSEPRFESIRSDSRFQELLRAMKL